MHETVLTGNSFTRHDLALHVWTADPAVTRCHSISVRGNDFNDNRIGLQFERVRDSVVTGNRIFANVEAGIKLITSTGVSTDGNRLSAG